MALDVSTSEIVPMRFWSHIVPAIEILYCENVTSAKTFSSLPKSNWAPTHRSARFPPRISGMQHFINKEKQLFGGKRFLKKRQIEEWKICIRLLLIADRSAHPYDIDVRVHCLQGTHGCRSIHHWHKHVNKDYVNYAFVLGITSNCLDAISGLYHFVIAILQRCAN